MPSDACRDFRGALAAMALGNIDDTEAIALRAHLDGCAECRADLRDLEAVSAVLPLAELDRVTEEPELPSQLGRQVLQRITTERRRRRGLRTRRALAIAAALLVVLGIGAALVVNRSDSGGGTEVVFPTVEGVHGQAVLEAHDAGTEVELDAGGLRTGERYWLWLTGDDGKRVAAGTFTGQPDDIHVTLTAGLPLRDTRRIWVTDEDDAVVLDAPLASAQ